MCCKVGNIVPSLTLEAHTSDISQALFTAGSDGAAINFNLYAVVEEIDCA